VGDYIVDDSSWPLVRVIVPASVDVRGMDRYLARVDGYLARRQPYVVLLDARASRALDVPCRERLREHRRRIFLEAQRYQLAMAFVAESAFQRAILAAILWLAPEPCPSKTFGTLADAEAWVTAFLTKARAA
jgi:hypothetical protein